MAVAEAVASLPAIAADCAHCGLLAPAGVEPDPSGRSFCCSGCATAWEILNARGLEHYDALNDRRRAPVTPSGRGFEEFDHDAFRALYVTQRPDGSAAVDLYVEGIQCSSCVWLIEHVPLGLDGALRAELDVSRSRVRVVWDSERATLSSIARLLDALGYRPHPFRGVNAEALRRAEDRAAVARIGVAGALAANTMLLALALYSGWFSGMERDIERYFRWLSLLLATPALLWPGRLFFRGAWKALRAGTLHMDAPIALALAAAWTRGAVNTVSGRGPIYFDGLAMLVFLLLVGRFLQQRAQRAATDSAELLHSLSPSVALVVGEDGVPREAPTQALLPGMVCEIRAGDTIPADGVVLEGRSHLDASLLTGESRLVSVAPGASVHAGTVNRTAALRVRVERAGEESRLGRILREVAAGAARRAPLVQLADRLSGPFVAVVLALALTTLMLWWGRDPSRAVDLAIAVLVVTCPCALALATPLAVTAAIGRAARAGILVKGGDALERLAKPGLLFLDKTGTVTEGRTSLVAWDGDDQVRTLVLALERHSSHPIARGFAEAWSDLAAPEAQGVVSTLGGGVEGVVGGRRVAVGSPAFVAARLRRPPGPGSGCGDASLTPVWVAAEGRHVATARFGDPLRPDAHDAVAALRARGFRPRLISGDDPAVVGEVARRLEFAPGEWVGAASPEAKLDHVERALAAGPVVMVGDGVNDAAAIARASVGVGVRGGAETCLAAADVFLARPGLAPLVSLVDGARRTLAVVRLNLAFSIAYNAVGVGLALAGWINPLVAAVLMPVSSLTVVLVSFRARTFDTPTRAETRWRA